MPDKKISSLTELLTLGNNDLVVIVDNTTTPLVPTTKKMKVSTLRTQLGAKIMFGKIQALTANTPVVITFDVPIGTDITGLDYTLLIDQNLSSEVVGITISARTENGFTIEAIDDTTVQLLAVEI